MELANENVPRTWIAVNVEVSPVESDLASWLIMDCGAIGCEITPLSDSRVLIYGVFDNTVESQALIGKSLKNAFVNYGLTNCLNSLRTNEIVEKDWLTEWKKGFAPFSVGEKLIIAPSWYENSVELKEMQPFPAIFIEPGMAFGTGLHATTKYCLRALERLSLAQNVLDVGTGSGILSIACALLHPASLITAIDIDPVAIDNARHNVALNGVQDRINLIAGSTELLDSQTFDTILSNLTCEDIVGLLLEYLRLLRPEGTIICAGILKEKLALLEGALTQYPLSIVESEVDEMWAGIEVKRIPVVISA